MTGMSGANGAPMKLFHLCQTRACSLSLATARLLFSRRRSVCNCAMSGASTSRPVLFRSRPARRHLLAAWLALHALLLPILLAPLAHRFAGCAPQAVPAVVDAAT